MVLDTFNQYDNINIVLDRSEEGEHNEKERYQTLEMSKDLDRAIEQTLIDNNLPYTKIKVGDNTLNDILQYLSI